MTERRLKEIFIETVFPTVGVTDETLLWFETVSSRQDYIEAMKQAVNEALEEVIANTDQFDHIHKDEILNLKVK